MSIYDRAKDALSKARFDEVNNDLMLRRLFTAMKSDDTSSEHTNWWNICMRELVDRSKEAYPFEDTP